MLDACSNMIENQLRAGGVYLPVVFEAFASVDRVIFMPDGYRDFAYADMQIPLGDGQQMFFPQTEAKVLQALSPVKSDTVLEIGTGSGFSAALLASVSRFVTTVEILPELAKSADRCLSVQGVRNIRLVCADGLSPKQYLNENQQFDLIVLSGGIKNFPLQMMSYLADGGRMVVFQQKPALTQVELVLKKEENSWVAKPLFETSVASLIEPDYDPFSF